MDAADHGIVDLEKIPSKTNDLAGIAIHEECQITTFPVESPQLEWLFHDLLKDFVECCPDEFKRISRLQVAVDVCDCNA